jgi:5-hydroxyisourate hydrolase-like protein (transthyretin family)
MSMWISLVPVLALMQAPAPVSPEVTGHVFDNASKQPLAGARVALIQHEPNRGMRVDVFDNASAATNADQNVQMAVTGEDGRFRFAVVVGRMYALRVRREGYANRDETMVRVFIVKADEAISPAEIGLDRPAALSGRLMDRETGAPLSSCSIFASTWRTENGARALRAGHTTGAMTDKSGHYAISNLAPGDYVIWAHRGPKYSDPVGTVEEFRAGGEPTYVESYFPGVDRREEALPVTLLSGASLENIDLKLTKRRAAAIRGCVHSDETVTLQLYRRQAREHSQNTLMVPRSFEPGACFRLEGLSPGHYIVAATASAADGTGPKAARVTVELDGNRVDGVDLYPRSGALLAGRLRMRDSADTPLPEGTKARVGVRRRDMQLPGDSLAARTASDGTFRLRGLMEGDYRVEGMNTPEGYKVGEVRYNGVRARSGVFTFSGGALDQRLELILDPATSSLDVSVDGGTKAAGVQVVLLPEEYDNQDPTEYVQLAEADSGGHAKFSGLLAGKYEVYAFAPDAHWRTGADFARHTLQSVNVELSTGGSRAVEVKISRLE